MYICVRMCERRIGSREGRSWNWRAPTELRLSTSRELKEEGGRDPLAPLLQNDFLVIAPVLTLRRDLEMRKCDNVFVRQREPCSNRSYKVMLKFNLGILTYGIIPFAKINNRVQIFLY